MKEAVELVWHGRAHWGLDDSINMARFLAVIMQRGFKFSITKSLTPPQAITQDSPITSNRHHQFLVLQRMCTFQHTSRDPAEVEEFRYFLWSQKLQEGNSKARTKVRNLLFRMWELDA